MKERRLEAAVRRPWAERTIGATWLNRHRWDYQDGDWSVVVLGGGFVKEFILRRTVKRRKKERILALIP
jgi:hypothetical protein